ncbi:MAG: cytochrome c [Pirellulaceae bacterium]|nr:cytochrome c [Pirellulaceae bacterium]
MMYPSNSLYKFVAVSFVLFCGCKDSTDPSISFEPNYLFAHRMGYDSELSTDQFLKDSNDLVTEWFGTPDAPKLPPLFAEDDYQELLSLEKMQPAVGPAIAGTEPGETGLYRQLCVSCHGETGQGRGTVAASQNPYPRDFRRGLYKYKVTTRNAKPLKSDLARSLREGLAGSQMPLFNKLSDTKIDALVEYVVYLSIRGEFERKLVTMGVFDLDPDFAFNDDPKKRERVYDVSYRDSSDEAKKRAFKDQVESATDILTDIADGWVAPKLQTIAPPNGIPVPGLTDEKDIDQTALAASIAKGRELFVNQVSACSKCHGESAKGDVQQLQSYDDWTNEWIKDIKDIDELLPFLARGGLKPQPLSPRNLNDGKLRGGRDPKAVYHRIHQGIAGTPMPGAAIAASATDAGLQPDDLWHLVNFVLSLK